MTPWTALLESFHSAALDALIELAPEPKPVLGLPSRTQTLSPPPQWTDANPSKLAACICPVYFGEIAALLAVVIDQEAQTLLPESDRIFAQIKAKLGHEFMMRKIKPRMGDPQALDSKALGLTWTLPSSFPSPSRVIWIPINLGQGKVLLAMGV